MDKGKKKEDIDEELEKLSLPLHIVLAAIVAATCLMWVIAPGDLTKLVFELAVSASAFLLAVLTFWDFREFQKERLNIISFMAAALLLCAVLTPSSMLLVILFTAYLVLAVLFSGRVLKLQTAVIIALAITAIMFRIYPALPGNGPSPGFLISMDDPYYHYKYTEDLYKTGDIANVDHRTYPPEGQASQHLFPYYYNTYLALMLGVPVHHMMLLYGVLLFAFGSVMMYFMLKELTGDWKSGALGGFLFATLPMLLTKSVAGATEEDPMGMVMIVMSMYFLIKAAKSTGTRSFKFAVISGVSFAITIAAWKGAKFLLNLPALSIALYLAVVFAGLIIMRLLGAKPSKEALATIRDKTWPVFLAAFISTAVYVALSMLVVRNFDIDLILIASTASLLLFGALCEAARFMFFRTDKEDEWKGRFLKPLAALVVLAVVAGVFFIGVDRVANLTNVLYNYFAGASATNFLVDKTISEQAALASGSIGDKLLFAMRVEYGAGELFTLLMLGGLPAIIAYHLWYSKKLDRFFDLVFAYIIGAAFFAVAMTFVWIEARLGFSQSLGFILLGATAGLMLPRNFKEIGTIKILSLFIIPVLLIFTFNTSVFENLNARSSWSAAGMSSSTDPDWFLAVKWLDNNINPGTWNGDTFTPGDYVFTWWDYGHFITALSRSTVITDPLQANENYIMRTARFFYNTTTEDEAVAWLMQQPFNTKDASGQYKIKYIILDYDLIGKASALAFLGTNSYEYPNGYEAVNGACSQGDICQNVENGLTATETDKGYSCAQGVVCPRDDKISAIAEKKCCEEKPVKCCNTTFDWRVVDKLGGSPRILRSPGSAVYGTYEIQDSGYICNRPEYSTSSGRLNVVEDGKKKVATSRALYLGYGGLPYGDGNDYVGLLMFNFDDGTQSVKFIMRNCKTVTYSGVMSLGKDRLFNLGGVRLGDSSVVPQVLVHIPQRWMKNMFTRLYLQDPEDVSADLKYFEPVLDNKAKEFYPRVKIFKVSYPAEIPVITKNETAPAEQPEEPNASVIFDAYDPQLVSKYGLTRFPSIVWNCQYSRYGSANENELDAIKKLTCIFNRGSTAEICASAGVAYDNGTVSTGSEDENKFVQALLVTVKKVGEEPCSDGNRSVMQVFYGKDCSACESHRQALEAFKAQFGDYVSISYYCAGDEAYCAPRTAGGAAA